MATQLQLFLANNENSSLLAVESTLQMINEAPKNPGAKVPDDVATFVVSVRLSRLLAITRHQAERFYQSYLLGPELTKEYLDPVFESLEADEDYWTLHSIAIESASFSMPPGLSEPENVPGTFQHFLAGSGYPGVKFDTNEEAAD